MTLRSLILTSIAAVSLTASAALPLEGTWKITGGAEILIKKGELSGAEYDVVSISSPDLRLPPGALIGSAESADAEGRKYVMRLATDVNDKEQPVSQRSFDAELQSGRLSLTPRRGYKFDMWMLYRLYLTVSLHRNKAPKNLEAVRIAPQRTPTIADPVIL